MAECMNCGSEFDPYESGLDNYCCEMCEEEDRQFSNEVYNDFES